MRTRRPTVTTAPAPATSSSQLSALFGSNPNGTWSLYVNDDHGRDEGSLSGWSLDFGNSDYIFADVSLSEPQKLPNGAFRMHLNGTPNKTYYIEASTDLQSWTIIQTNQLSS